MPLSLRLALSILAGASAGVFLGSGFAAWWPWCAAGAAGTALLARADRRPLMARVAGWAACACAVAALSAHADAVAREPPLRTLLGSRPPDERDAPVAVEGILARDGTAGESGTVLQVDVARAFVDGRWQPARGGVSVTVAGTQAGGRAGDWRAGRRLRVTASLRRPSRYLDVGVADGERALARRGAALTGGVKSAALVEVVAPGGPLDEAASAARAAVRRSLQRYVGAEDPQAAAIATAILIGDRGALTPDVQRRLQQAGTYHVIAISGGNIAILAGLVLAALAAAGIRGPAAAGVSILVLSAYAFLAGGGASVLRATIMASTYLALRLIDQRTSPAHAIATTAAALLVWSPLSVADAGFWLTFGATMGIVIAATRVQLPSGPWLREPLALVLASAAAEAALMPVSARAFERVTVAGLALNFAAIPCMAVVQVAAMLTVAADALAIHPLATAAGWATRVAATGLVASAQLVDMAPWSSWRVPAPSVASMAAYYAALTSWLVIRPGAVAPTLSRLRGAAFLAAVALYGAIGAPPVLRPAPPADGRLHLTMIDVGQGESILATLPNGRTLLVDGGGLPAGSAFDIGDRVVGPALRARGITRLDYVVATHGDADHIGGLPSAVADFAPAEVWEGVAVTGHEPSVELRQASDLHRAAWRTVRAGQSIAIGGVTVLVRHPPEPDWERMRVRNDDSVVLELRLGRVSFLLTGDIGREAERALLPSLDLGEIVVLKAPHHGSATSSSVPFIAATHPSLVLFSAGRGNPFGHPVPAVVDRYRRAGAAIFRTDEDGEVEVITDGWTVEARGFTGRRWRLARGR